MGNKLHERSLDRMEIASAIPLEPDLEDSSNGPVSVLDQNFECFRNTLSSITENMDSFLAIYRKKGRHKELLPLEIKHKITAYKSGLKSQTMDTPDPTSYYSNYDFNKPSNRTIRLQPKEGTNAPKTTRVFSTAELIRRFDNNIRDFNIKEIEMPISNYEPESSLIDKHRFYRTISGQKARDYSNPQTTAGHLDPMEPRPAPQKPCLNFDRMSERVFEYPKDDGRYYELAVEQRDKLRPRIITHDFSRDTSRETTRKANKKLELRSRLIDERHKFIEHISMINKEKITHREKQIIRRPKSSFEAQLGRSERMFPGQKVAQDEPILPFDPIKSYRNTLPRVKTVVIRPTPPQMNDVMFWATTNYSAR